KRGFTANRLQTNNPFYLTSTRRSLYLPVVRNALPDVLSLFDAADPNGVTPVRNDTTVPSQALFSLNNPFVRDQSLALAKSLLAKADQPEADRPNIGAAYIRCLGRYPTDAEQVEALDYLTRYTAAAIPQGSATPEANEAAWKKAREEAWQSFCQMLF